MSRRQSSVVTVRVPVENPDGIGEITAQIRLHWPARATVALVADVLRQAVESVEVAAGLTVVDR